MVPRKLWNPNMSLKVSFWVYPLILVQETKFGQYKNLEGIEKQFWPKVPCFLDLSEDTGFDSLTWVGSVFWP